MTKNRQTPVLLEKTKDFYYEHPFKSAAVIGTAGALSLMGLLAGINAYLQPASWKGAISQAARNDGFSDARYSFLPDVFNRGIAKTTLTYAGCEIEGVTVSLLYQDDQLVDISSYDFSTAVQAVEAGVVPQTISKIANAQELSGHISLQKCLG